MPAALNQDEIFPEILALIATTSMSLEAICNSDARFPDARTIYRWIDANEELCQRYTRAKAAQLQILADQLIDLADKDRVCEKRTIKADGSEERVILDQVERTKVQIDTRKWLLSKLDPKKYGDRVQQEVTGKDGAPLTVNISITPVKPLHADD